MTLREKLRDFYLIPAQHIQHVECTIKLPSKTKISELYQLSSPGGSAYALAALASDHNSALSLLTEIAIGTETIGLIGIFDTNCVQYGIYRRKFDSNKVERIPEMEFHAPKRQGESRSRSRHNNNQAITEKLENVLFEIHSVMRDVDGLHADAALEELCKLLYVKAYTEESTSSVSSLTTRIEDCGTNEERAAAIRTAYREAINYDLRVFRLKIPQYERSRGVFQDPIKLSSTALVKSFSTLLPYSLRTSKADVKGRAFQKVLGKAVRSGMGQYFTPQEVCQFIVDVVKPEISDLILDPFCGSGHFLSLSLDRISRNTSSSSKEFHEFAFGKLHGIEKSDRMTRVAMTDMRLRGDGHSNIRCVDALLSFENYPDISPESFDVVLTNPPFGSLIGSDALSQLGSFELSRRRKNVPLEVLGLERSIAFLRPGGRIGIVLPDSIFSADSTSHIRDWIHSKIKIRAVVGLPVETFSPYGANVKTSILFGRKWSPGEVRGDNYPICMITLESIGYDASGRPKQENDLKPALDVLNAFLSKHSW